MLHRLLRIVDHTVTDWLDRTIVRKRLINVEKYDAIDGSPAAQIVSGGIEFWS